MKNVRVSSTLGVILLATALIGCTQTTEGGIEGQLAGFQKNIIAAMTDAAKRADVTINTDHLVTGSGIGGFVALAPIASTRKSTALMYFSFANDVECSKLLPPGFYVVDPVGSGTKKVVNLYRDTFDGPLATSFSHDPTMEKLEVLEHKLHGVPKAGVKVINKSHTNIDVAVWFNTKEGNTHIGM